jgi:hypothetical protein
MYTNTIHILNAECNDIDSLCTSKCEKIMNDTCDVIHKTIKNITNIKEIKKIFTSNDIKLPKNIQDEKNITKFKEYINKNLNFIYFRNIYLNKIQSYCIILQIYKISNCDVPKPKLTTHKSPSRGRGDLLSAIQKFKKSKLRKGKEKGKEKEKGKGKKKDHMSELVDKILKQRQHINPDEKNNNNGDVESDWDT